MIFEELVLTDVGPFKGEHRIALAPAATETPVVLFGGLNGAGKTTVLESLLLALYGPHTPGSARRAISFEKYLDQLINHDADRANGASVELLFRAVHEGQWRSFQVLRSWAMPGGKLRENVSVVRDGMPDPVLAASWTDYIETLAPRGVASLFFFDGEQIEAFADLEVARDLVSTAISGLLGLDLVDRLQNDLLVLEKRKRQHAAENDELSAHAKALQEQLAEATQAVGNAQQVVENLERRLKDAEQKAKAAATRLAREGGERYQVADEIRARAAQSKERAAREAKALVDALAGLGPLAMVQPLLKRTIGQATAEQHQADNQTVAALLAERDTQILELLRDQRAAVKIQQAVAEFLSVDLEQRKAGDGVPAVLGVDADLLAFAQRLAATDLDTEGAVLRDSVSRLEQAQELLADAKHAEDSLQVDWAVQDTLKAHQEAADALAQLQGELAVAINDRDIAIAARGKIEREIASDFEKANLATLKSHEAARIVEYSARARETLEKLRAVATERHVKRIESLILESLQSLLRKDNLIKDVRIDPVTCSVELLTLDGRPVRPRSLSAGERQLVAVSLLAGLARASGRMLPVVIDTPLGRLDQDHRKRLLQRYLPNASHQVIVLSTDTEITPEALSKLGPSVSHMIKIEHDPATRSSTVHDGYFVRPEQADFDDDEEQE